MDVLRCQQRQVVMPQEQKKRDDPACQRATRKDKNLEVGMEERGLGIGRPRLPQLGIC